MCLSHLMHVRDGNKTISENCVRSVMVASSVVGTICGIYAKELSAFYPVYPECFSGLATGKGVWKLWDLFLWVPEHCLKC